MTTELKNRLMWGIGAALAVILVIFVLGPEVTFLLSLGLSLLGWREYSRMMKLVDREALYYPGYLLLFMIFTHSFFMGPMTFFWIWFVWAAAFFILFFEMIVKRKHQVAMIEGVVSTDQRFDPEATWRDLCRFVLGIFYVFMIFGFVGPICLSKIHGERLLCLGLSVTFVGDTAAYFVGKRWGKRKLWPEISPGKTLEGALGGWVGSVLAALIVWLVLLTRSDIGLWQVLVVGFLSAPLAQAGDFLESLMKRAAGKKDSGDFMPGHGGILDRADGLVFVLPLIYFLF